MLLGIVVYGVGFVTTAWTAPAAQFQNEDKPGVMIGGVVVVALYVLGMLVAAFALRGIT